jgi:hypothetical protein
MGSMNYFLILYQILIQLYLSHSRLRITTQSVIINMSCIFKIFSHLEYNFFQQEVRLGMEGKMGDVIYSIVIPFRSNILIVLSLETSGTGNIDKIYRCTSDGSGFIGALCASFIIAWFGLWCLIPLSTIFQLYHGSQF